MTTTSSTVTGAWRHRFVLIDSAAVTAPWWEATAHPSVRLRSRPAANRACPWSNASSTWRSPDSGHAATVTITRLRAASVATRHRTG